MAIAGVKRLTSRILFLYLQRTECRGAQNPQSELGYIAPDSLFCFSLPRIDIMTAVFAVNQ